MSDRKRRVIIVYSIIGVLVVSVLFLRSFYGIAFSDEVCYLASLKRYIQGDRFLLDDWHPPTQLTSWILYGFARWIPDFSITVLGARICYLVFQLLVTGGILFLLREHKGKMLVALMYLCSAPYNIVALSYNTVGIGMFFLACICFVCNHGKRYEWILSGIFFAFSVLCNPYLILLYIVYVIVCVMLTVFKVKNGVFAWHKFVYVSIGAATIAVIFVLSLLGKGSFEEYRYNIAAIFGDTEHAENRNLVIKFLMSQYEVIRVYWRASVPMGIIGLYTIFRLNRLEEDKKKRCILFVISCLVTIYVTFRFAFIYGSISINMMLVPLTFLGIETFLLILAAKKTELGKANEYFAWLVIGYLFAVCNYLGTNTEILSMSAMFVIPSASTVLLLYEYLTEENVGTDRGVLCQKIVAGIAIAVYVGSMFYLRMTFIWYDGKLSELDTRIAYGPAKGIYTTSENADAYHQLLQGIDSCGITEEDRVLFMPIDPLCFYHSEGEIAAPYITRFSVDFGELERYYESHPHKFPTKVVVTDCVDGEYTEEEAEVIDYFLERGYEMIWINETFLVLQE